MKRNKLLNSVLIIFFLLLMQCFNLYAQEGVDYISFSLNNTKRIPNHDVSIVISKIIDNVSVKVRCLPMETYKTEWKHTKIDTIYIISNDDFNNLFKSIKQINFNEFNKQLDFVKKDGEIYITNDGIFCSISYGNQRQSIDYNFMLSTDKNEDKNFQYLIQCCKLISHYAKLKSDDIF